MMPWILALLLCGPAMADDAGGDTPSTDDTQGEAAEATPEVPVEKLPPVPPSLGQLTPDRLMALRTYKSQRLQVRAETEYRGSSVATFTSMSYGYPRGMGTGVVVTDNISTFRTWGVYRGPQRLSAPDFLHLAQAAERRDALRLH